MQNETDGQDLIQAFFAALALRQLDQCAAILAQLKSLSHKQPIYIPWCAYFDGILVSERDHDWAEAERIFSRLLLTDLDPPLRGRALMALGKIQKYQGHWQEAIRTYERSLSLFAELDRPIDQVKAWKQIAISYRRGFTQGDFGPRALQQAITYCRSALDVLEPMADPPPDVTWLKGSVWNTLGAIYLNLGQWDDALSCYQQDLAICRSLSDPFGMGLSYGNLGEVYQKRGPATWPEALDAYQQALHIIREFDDRYEEIDVLANLGSLYREMGAYELALDHYDQAIDLIEVLRAGVSTEAARAGFFATTIETYANMVLLCLEAGQEAWAFNYVERARSRAFLDVLTAPDSRPQLSRDVAATPLTLAQVQAALPADALLIEYFTTGLIEAQNGGDVSHQVPHRHRFPPARTLIFAVTCERIQVHDAGLSPKDLLPRHLTSVVERHFLKPEIRRVLYDRLVAPVQGLLQGRRRLYLVPHGPLHYIPFQALISPDGETLLREHGPPLVYAPSATILFRHDQEKSGQAPVSCLALGYNDQGATQLRFAEEEALSVARLTGGQVLAGPSLKKAVLYDQAANYQVLHFSCHGEFDPQMPLASALHLAPGEALTALEVLQHLRLRCDLVTLSACESGLSRVRRGDELVGLMRAFMHAGAPALVSTLWRVDERSTLILMEKFYRQIQTGMDFAEALSQAQLYLKNLTHRAALDVLARLLTDKILNPLTPLDESQSEFPAPIAASRQARAYLKGAATKGGQDSTTTSLGERDDDKIFADPYYWAAFVLVGDRGLGALAMG